MNEDELRFQIEQTIKLNDCIRILREKGYEANGSVIDGVVHLTIRPQAPVEPMNIIVEYE